MSVHIIEHPLIKEKMSILRDRETSSRLFKECLDEVVMLMAFDETGKVFNASVCGDNCAKWILEIARRKDLSINLRHIMDFGDGEFEARILNTGEVVHDMRTFVRIAGKYV